MVVPLEALLLYLKAWFQSFSRRGRRLAPLGPRRLLFLALAPLGFLLFLVHWVCLGLDLLLFPRFRRVELRKPLFILGVPRSGTTFLHRQLARDPEFTTTKSWELVLAPSLCQRRVIGVLSSADRFFGGHGGRLLNRLVRAFSSDMDAIHAVGLEDAEEDYLALLPAAGCFMAAMAFPAFPVFHELAAMRKLSPARRTRLLRHYRALLQRHVYAHGGLQLLSKNAAFASWAPYLAQWFPDAVFVVCIREPALALSSQLSSLRPARQLFASFPRDADLEEVFAELYDDWYKELHRCLAAAKDTPLVIEQEWLRNHTAEALELIYARLGRDVPGSTLETVSTGPVPVHRHSPGDRKSAAEAAQRDAGAAYVALAAEARAQRSPQAAA